MNHQLTLFPIPALVQDSTFLYTEPPSATGFWVALEEATIANGCLWVLPGSHKGTAIRGSVVSNESTVPHCPDFDFALAFHVLSGGPARRFFVDQSRQVAFEGEPGEYEPSKFVAVPVKAGSAVLLHGALVHNRCVRKEIGVVGHDLFHQRVPKHALVHCGHVLWATLHF